MAVLYVVATPIGNLQDLSARGIETLRNADLIIAEDTRVTMKLCQVFGLKAPLVSCHRHSEDSKAPGLARKILAEDLTAALVTDAGTPCISDPGSEVVRECAEAGITMMNKKSGLLGISGKSSDCRDIDDLASKGDPNAKLAQEMLIYGIKKYIGSYAAAMGGVDIIVFTAGIGENNADLRAQVIDGLDFMGAKIDPEKNKTRKEAVISAEDSKVTVCVIPTNEEIMIARDTLDLVTTGKVRDN